MPTYTHTNIMNYVVVSIIACSLIAISIIATRYIQNTRQQQKPRNMSYATLWKCIQAYPSIDIDYLKYIEETGSFSVIQSHSSRRRMLRDGIIFFQGTTPRLQPLLAQKIANINRTNPTQLYI